MIDLSLRTVKQLLELHAAIGEELRARKIVRSSNNPVADYSELLFCCAFNWDRTENSNKDVDALDDCGTRFQVKGRRPTRHNQSRQLGIIRRLDERSFDDLAGVIFNEDYTVDRAALVPHALVMTNSNYVKSTNGWRFILRDEVWTWEGVRDVTRKLQAVEV